jgi:hypothetical protein
MRTASDCKGTGSVQLWQRTLIELSVFIVIWPALAFPFGLLNAKATAGNIGLTLLLSALSYTLARLIVKMALRKRPLLCELFICPEPVKTTFLRAVHLLQ